MSWLRPRLDVLTWTLRSTSMEASEFRPDNSGAPRGSCRPLIPSAARAALFQRGNTREEAWLSCAPFHREPIAPITCATMIGLPRATR